MSLFQGLKRRNVFKVGVAYVVLSWLLAQVAEMAVVTFAAPGWVMKMLERLEGDPRYESIRSRMIEHPNRERVQLGLEPRST